MIYCTLFNSNYLDRGIVMMNSLMSVDHTSKIYVLCMDSLCMEILAQMNISSLFLISLSEFEDEELLAIKKARSPGEYCWTCTAKLIKYVIEHYHVDACTYIDADMYFYSDPSVLIKEMIENKCSVQAVPHRFAPGKQGERRAAEYGRLCVQFNTFCREEKSLELLNAWIHQCLLECSVYTMGDQMYTDSWCELPFVNISNNAGAGVAPWNINRYKLTSWEEHSIKDRFTKENYNLIFYHFQKLVFPQENKVYISPMSDYWALDRRLVKKIYTSYLDELYCVRESLKKDFNFSPVVRTYITTEMKKRSLKDKVLDYAHRDIDEILCKLSSMIRHLARKKKMYYSFPVDKTKNN